MKTYVDHVVGQEPTVYMEWNAAWKAVGLSMIAGLFFGAAIAGAVLHVTGHPK